MAGAKNGKRKYVLFSKEDGRPDSLKPCAFFNSVAGCKNGKNCKFMHGSAIQEPAVAPVQVKHKDIILPQEPKLHADDIKRDGGSAEKKRKIALDSSKDDEIKALKKKLELLEKINALENTKERSTVQSTESKPTPDVKKKDGKEAKSQKLLMAPTSNKGESSDDEDKKFLFGAVNTAINGFSPNAFPNDVLGNPVSAQNLSSPIVFSGAAGKLAESLFIRNDEVMKNLQTSGTSHATHGGTKKQVFANARGSPKSSKKELSNSPAPGLVRPKPHQLAAPVAPAAEQVFDVFSIAATSLPWGEGVLRTKSHGRFKKDYLYEVDHSWVTPRPAGDWSRNMSLPAVIAIDCEMCETEDPLTREKFGNTLVRFSAINGLNSSEVLVDSLVAPSMPVTDMRTHIHGITEQQLTGIQFTLRHAQAILYNLCTENTVLVGHSLHNDLRSLRFNHTNVVDTAYLYTVESEPGASPSIRDIADQILGSKLPEVHDSVQDAKASLYAAMMVLAKGPQKAIVRASGRPMSSAQVLGPHLLMHRIPSYCTEEHIQQIIVEYAQVIPTKVSTIIRGPTDDKNNPCGKTTIIFASQQHADLAFESISGPNRPDKQGKPQKRIYMKGGGYVCVRK